MDKDELCKLICEIQKAKNSINSETTIILDDVYAFFDKDKMADNHKDKFFIIGDVYSIKGIDCDGFTMPTKRYKLISIIKTISGIKLNSIVVKRLNDDNSLIFSLTKSDCKKLGIEFQNGLEILPMNLDWIHEVEENEFDPNDLSTYPTSFKTRLIHNITVKINNVNLVKCSKNSLRKLFFDKKLGIFFTALNFTSKDINIKIIDENIIGNFYADNYILVELKISDNNGNGINPQYLAEKSFLDVFDTYWAISDAVIIDNEKNKDISHKKEYYKEYYKYISDLRNNFYDYEF